MSFSPSRVTPILFVRTHLQKLVALVALSTIVGLSTFPCAASDASQNLTVADATTGSVEVSTSDQSSEIINQPVIEASAEHLYIFSTNRGTTLYRTTASEPQNIPAASKLMTAVIAIESLTGDTLITISEDVESLDKASAKPVSIKKGAKYSVSFLVAAMLYRNSDAAALSLAEYISNDELTFVSRMNDMAKTLSMKNTNYVNTSGENTFSGVPSDVPYPSGSKQFSTVDDLSILFRYALNLTGFREIFTDYSMLDFQDSGRPLSISSLVISAWGIDHVLGAQLFPANGDETSGNSCLLALASKDNFEIGIVLTNFADNKLYADLKQTVNSIFDFYEVSNLIEAGDAYRLIEVEGVSEPIHAVFKNSIMYIHPIGKDYTIPGFTFTPSKVLSLPIKKGDTLGQVEIVLEDGTQIITEVVAEEGMAVKLDFLSEAQALLDTNKNISILIIGCMVSLLLFICKNVISRLCKSKKNTSHF